MVVLGWSALPNLRLGNPDALCGVRAIIRVVAHRDLPQIASEAAVGA